MMKKLSGLNLLKLPCRLLYNSAGALWLLRFKMKSKFVSYSFILYNDLYGIFINKQRI